MGPRGVTAREVLVAGHICLDIIPDLGTCKGNLTQWLLPGRLINTGPARLSGGGCVSNTGLALHRLGVPVRLVGKIGDDLFGSALRSIFEDTASGLSDGLIVSASDPTSYTLVLSPPDVDRVFFLYPGANDTSGAADLCPAIPPHGGLLHFGYPPLMLRMCTQEGSELVEVLRHAQTSGYTVSLDTAWPDPLSEKGRAPWPTILRRALPFVDLFLPSLEELLQMLEHERTAAKFGLRLDDAGRLAGLGGLRELADLMIEWGAAVVLLKLGDQGLYLRSTPDRTRIEELSHRAEGAASWLDRELYVPAYKAEAVGATGAGDSAIAGFLTGWNRDFSPEAAVLLAAASGACSVEAPDATSGVTTVEQIARRQAAGWPQHRPPFELPGWGTGENGAVRLSPQDARRTSPLREQRK